MALRSLRTDCKTLWRHLETMRLAQDGCVRTNTECAALLFIRIPLGCTTVRTSYRTERGKVSPIFFNRFQSSSLNNIPLFLNVH